MKKNYFLILFCFLIYTAYSQKCNYFSMSFAQTFSTFKYKDSQGNKDSEMNWANHFSYALNLSRVFKNNVYLIGEIGFKQLGANSSIYNQKLNWHLNYLDANIGFGKTFKKKNSRFYSYIGISGYGSLLLTAQQTVGNNYYNLIEKDTAVLRKTDYGATLHLGINIRPFGGDIKNTLFFIELRPSMGLCQLEENTEGHTEELKNNAISIYAGLRFKFDKNTLPVLFGKRK